MRTRLFLIFALLGCTGISSNSNFSPLSGIRETSKEKIEKPIVLEHEKLFNKHIIKFRVLENVKNYYIYSSSDLQKLRSPSCLIRKITFKEIEKLRREDYKDNEISLEKQYLIYSIKNFNNYYMMKIKLKDGQQLWSKCLELSLEKTSNSTSTTLDSDPISQTCSLENQKIVLSQFYNSFDGRLKDQIDKVLEKIKSKSETKIIGKILELIDTVEEKSNYIIDLLNEEGSLDGPNVLTLNIVINKALVMNTITPALDEIKKLDMTSLSRDQLSQIYIELIILKIEVKRVERSPTNKSSRKSSRSRRNSLRGWTHIKLVSLSDLNQDIKKVSIEKEKLLKRSFSEN